MRIPAALEAELENLATDAGCELAAAIFSGNVLKVVLDHHEGVTLEHCETVSRELSAFLDAEDFGRERYVLEVTSPGLDRELYRARDYERFVGSAVKVTFRDESGKATKTGLLQAFHPNPSSDDAERGASSGPAATFVWDDSGESVTLSLDAIKTCRLIPQI